MPGTFSPPPWVSDPDMHHGTCVMHVPWCMMGSLTSGFLWRPWRGKRSRQSWRMRNSQFTYLVRGPCGAIRLSHDRPKWWLVAGSSPSHYLNQCWLLVKKTHKKNTSVKFVSNYYKQNHPREWCIRKGCLQLCSRVNVLDAISSAKYVIDVPPPSATYQGIGSTLVQIMACRLFGAKPVPEPMPTYCQLDPQEQTSVKFESKYKTFHSWKCK